MAGGKVVVGIILMLLAAAFYWFYRWLYSGERKPGIPYQEAQRWYSPFFTNPFARANIEKIHRQHTQRRKEAEHEGLIEKFGGKKEFISEDFQKLKQLIHQQKKWSLLTKEEQDAFRKLQRLVKKSESKVVRMSKEEREEVVRMLRKIRDSKPAS